MAWQTLIRTAVDPVDSRMKLNGSHLDSLGRDATDVRNIISYDFKSLKYVI